MLESALSNERRWGIYELVEFLSDMVLLQADAICVEQEGRGYI